MVSTLSSYAETCWKSTIDFTPLFDYKLPAGVPPSDAKIEEMVLGSIMTDFDAMERVKDMLEPQAFYVPAHQEIYKICLQLHHENKSTDLMSVLNRLSRLNRVETIGGTSKLAQCCDPIVHTYDLKEQAKELMGLYARRQLLNFGYQITEFIRAPLSPDKILETVEEQMLKLTRSPSYYLSKEEAYTQKLDRIIKELRDIQLNIDRSALKFAKIRDLAKKNGYTHSELERLYYKSIVDEMYEPFMSLAEAKEKYGAELTKWFMNGVAPKGQTILVPAPGGTGKTLLAHDLMFRLMTGTDLDEFSVSRKARKCLYIQVDTPADVALVSMAERGIEEGMPIKMTTKWSTEHIAQLRKEIVNFGAEFVVIDSLSAASKFNLVSENDVDFARPILELNTIAQELGVTILLLHHTNKNGGPRGSTAIYNAVSMVLEMKRDPRDPDLKSTRRIISITKARSRCPETYVWEMNTDDKSWHCLGRQQEEDQMPNTMRKSIINFLKKHTNTKYEAKELKEYIGGSYNHLRQTVSELAQEGLIYRTRKTRGQPYKYFLESDDLEQSTGSCLDPLNGSCQKQRPEPNIKIYDPMIAQNIPIERGDENKKGQKTTIIGSQAPKTLIQHSKEHDPHTGSISDPVSERINNNNFFECQTANAVSPQNDAHIGSINNNHSPEPLVTPTYSKGDRVTYTGDRPVHKGKIFEIVRPAPDTWCDFSYICQDVAKPKATTVRLKEDDLKLVEKNDG